MENVIQYGPYSPQEVDRITVWLKQQNLKFELIRNDQEAKEALMNDGQNLVNLADLRTGIYLAQVFYVNLLSPNESEKKSFEDLFCLKAEVYRREKGVSAEDDQLLAKDSLRNQRKKRGWAILLSVLLILQVMVALYFMKES